MNILRKTYKQLLALLLMVISFSALAQITNIPDPNFEQALIDLGIDSDGVVNGQVLTSDIEGVEELDVSDRGISNLTGIEDFIALEEMNVRLNNLSNIDLSNNTLLKMFDCWGNNFTSLNLSNNILLETLVARANPISTLDLSENTLLKYLNCSYCPLTSLNLTNNSELEYLEIIKTSLSNIDLSQNTNLEILKCGVNSFSSLNLTNNINLTHLSANVIHTLSGSGIDLSNNSLLEYLNIDDTWLGYIDVTANAELKILIATFCFLSEINLSQNVNLEYLDVSGNNLTALNLDENIQLKELYCSNYGGFYGMQISTLDLSNNVNLEIFDGENLLDLEHINAKNGNNEILSIGVSCEIEGYPCQLPFICIMVDDEAAATNNQYPYSNWYIAAEIIVYTENEDCLISIPSHNRPIVTIYPNPTADQIFINNPNQDNLNVRLHTISGQLLLEKEFGYTNNFMSIESLSSGTYFLVVENQLGEKTVKKVVKK